MCGSCRTGPAAAASCAQLPSCQPRAPPPLLAVVKGKRYKRLLHDMKLGMRTYNDNEKMRRKAEARREKKRPEREQKQRDKRKRQRTGKTAEDIEKKKAAFQEKKARRLARKAAAEQEQAT